MILVVLVLVAVGGVAFLVSSSGDDDDDTAGSTTTTAQDSDDDDSDSTLPTLPDVDDEDTTIPDIDLGDNGGPPDPAVTGDDPALDALSQSCYEGDMQACDDLFFDSPAGSDYEDYGNTCGHRFEFSPGLCTSVEDPVIP